MKSKKEHRVPLSSRALEVLSQARKLGAGEGLVFPGTKYGKPLSDMTLSKLTKELGYDVDVHGFRTSFKTWTQERTNTPRDVSEAALAHTVKDKAEAAYGRSAALTGWCTKSCSNGGKGSICPLQRPCRPVASNADRLQCRCI